MIMHQWYYNSQWPREGEQGERPPPKQKKIVVEISVYLREVIHSEQRAEIIEKFRGKIMKEFYFP